jgi:putative ABC transport system ATP-binding protein
MDDLVICENLVKIYQQSGIEVIALQGLDLRIKPGEMVGIVGASGSGKTTLLNVLGGLDRPTAGKAVVDRQDLLKLSDRQMDVYRKQKVGFIWQQPGRNLLPYLSAVENVMLPMWLGGVPRLKRRKRAAELLDTLGLSDRKDHKPVQLSGGEQQRTAIAVALANRPTLLLADEPTGEVDTATARDIYNALHKTTAAYGTTTVIVSHDPLLSRYTQRVVTMRDGKTSTEKIRLDDNENRTEGEITRAAGDRHRARAQSSLEREGSPQLEEYILLDSAGRLQVPKYILEALNISDRVRLELNNDTAVIHPVEDHNSAKNFNPEKHENEHMINLVSNEGVHTGLGGAVRNWLAKTWKRGKNDQQSGG